MTVEPLTIKDEKFMVKSTIERCPTKMMIRELIWLNISSSYLNKMTRKFKSRSNVN